MVECHNDCTLGESATICDPALAYSMGVRRRKQELRAACAQRRRG